HCAGVSRSFSFTASETKTCPAAGHATRCISHAASDTRTRRRSCTRRAKSVGATTVVQHLPVHLHESGEVSFHPGYKPVAVGPQGNGPQEFRQQFPCPTQDSARVILAGPIRSSPIAGFSSIQAVRGRFLPGFAVE